MTTSSTISWYPGHRMVHHCYEAENCTQHGHAFVTSHSKPISVTTTRSHPAVWFMLSAEPGSSLAQTRWYRPHGHPGMLTRATSSGRRLLLAETQKARGHGPPQDCRWEKDIYEIFPGAAAEQKALLENMFPHRPTATSASTAQSRLAARRELAAAAPPATARGGGTPLHPPHLHPPGKGGEHAAPRCSPQHSRSQI